MLLIVKTGLYFLLGCLLGLPQMEGHFSDQAVFHYEMDCSASEDEVVVSLNPQFPVLPPESHELELCGSEKISNKVKKSGYIDHCDDAYLLSSRFLFVSLNSIRIIFSFHSFW